MYKPSSLRKHLGATVPDLKRDPDKLVILVRAGKTIAAGEASLSFEYQYTVQIIVLDYEGHADAIVLPILVWMRTHQPDYFDNPKQRESAFRFEAEYNNAKTIDLSIELDLTESVGVVRTDSDNPTAHGRYNIAHIGEPVRTGTLEEPEAWEFWSVDGLLASWSYVPGEFDDAPRMTDALA
jgi:hypothetical protein